MYMAFQNCHGPVQAPEKYTEKYSFITDETRRTYAGMVSITDEAIGNITQTMKDAGYGPFFFFYLTSNNLRVGFSRLSTMKLELPSLLMNDYFLNCSTLGLKKTALKNG